MIFKTKILKSFKKIFIYKNHYLNGPQGLILNLALHLYINFIVQSTRLNPRKNVYTFMEIIYDIYRE